MNKYTEISQRLNRKPHSIKPDDDVYMAVNQIHLAVGATCSAFEILQLFVVNAFGQICTGKPSEDTGKLISIIGGVSTSNFKIDMLKQAVNVYIGDDRKREATKKWISLIVKAASRRNDIAHGIVTFVGEEGKDASKAVLCPPFFDPKKGPFMSNNETLFQWDAPQIFSYCGAIQELQIIFPRFIQKVIGVSTDPEEEWMFDPDQLLP